MKSDIKSDMAGMRMSFKSYSKFFRTRETGIMRVIDVKKKME
jgi:hypothetical protein